MLSSTKVLLIDGIGAIISAVSLGIIIPACHSYFKVPLDVLYILAGIAVLFSVYSFFFYMYSGENWKKFLRVIAIANLSYCFLTAALLIKFLHAISVLAVAYFVSEIVLVIGLAIWELKVAAQK
jgi:hypothetical protein